MLYVGGENSQIKYSIIICQQKLIWSYFWLRQLVLLGKLVHLKFFDTMFSVNVILYLWLWSESIKISPFVIAQAIMFDLGLSNTEHKSSMAIMTGTIWITYLVVKFQTDVVCL